jgi:hypothetical protein
MRFAAVALAAMLVLGSISGVVVLGVDTVRAADGGSSVVEGTPNLNASAPDARLNPGQDGAVGVTLTNDAHIDDNNETHPQEAIDRAGEARSVRANITDTRDAPITVETGEQPVGTIQDGESSGPHTFNVHVDEDAQAGTYEIEVTTRYRHAKRVEYEERADGDVWFNETVVNRTETETVTVVIEPEAQFNVTGVEHDVPLGGKGIVSVEITNTGDENVTESTVSLTSSDSDFYFSSGTATSEAEVGEWKAGETKQLRFRAGTVDDAVQRSYPIDVSISYTNSDDNQVRDTEQIGITPLERTRFEVVSVDHDVPQDGEGTMTVEIAHSAGKSIEDVSVTASTTESEVYLGSEGSRSATAGVGAWGANENKQLTFRVGTTGNAVNRSYSIDLEFEYTDADDNENSRTTFFDFRPKERESFAINAVDHDVPLDGEGTVTITADLLEEKDVSDVTVTARTTESELYIGSEGSRSATALIGEWGAGEEHPLTFRMGTTENAVDRTYPIEVTFEYTDAQDNENAHTEYVEIRPKQRQRFDVEVVDHDIPQDGEGTITVEVDHRAGKDIEDVSVTVRTTASEVYVGSEGSRSAKAMVGEWGSDETKQLTFRVGTTENAVNRSYPLELEFEYTDADDNENSRAEYIAFRPEERDAFAIRSVDHDVPQNGEGTLTLTADLLEDKDVSDVTVTVRTTESELYIGSEGSRSGQAVIKSWPAGEQEALSFRVGTTENAVDRPYPIEVVFEYTDAANNENTHTEHVEIRPKQRKRFDVEVLQHDVPRDGEGTMTVEISHSAGKSIEDVSVTASTTESEVYLGSEGSRSATSMIGSLGPNETTQVTFRVGTTENAVNRSYPLELDLEYTDDANNQNSRTAFVRFRPQAGDSFEISLVDHDVPENGEGTVTIAIDHDGNETVSDVSVTTTAQSSEVYVGSESSRSETSIVEEWSPGKEERFTFRVGTTENAVDRAYPLEVALDYTDADDNDNSQTDRVEFYPGDRDWFRIDDVDHDVPQNGEGTVALEVTHIGNKTISDVAVTASTTASDVYLGAEASRSSTAVIDEWSPNETRQLTFRTGTTADAVNRTYPIDVNFDFTDATNNDNERTETVEFVPTPRQQFRAYVSEHHVPRNGEGTVTITLENVGPKEFRDVSLTATTPASEVRLGSEASRSASALLRRLSPGEERRLTFRVGTSEEAVQRPYPIELTLDYTDDDDNDNQRTKYVEFQPRGGEQFEIVSVEHDVPQNGEGTLTLVVDHPKRKEVSDVRVRAQTSDSDVYVGAEASGAATTMVDDWGYAERERLTFRIGTTQDAVARAYPIEVAFEYTDADDNENTQTEYVEFTPKERDHFRIESVEHDVPTSGEGTILVTITHTGNDSIEDVTATASTAESELYLGSQASRSATAMVGEWEPGETRRLTYRVGTQDVVERTYPLELAFEYTDDENNENRDTEYVEFVPRDTEHFAVQSFEHDVPRDGVGTVTVAIQHELDKPITDVLLTASTSESEVYLSSESSRSATAIVGEWDPNETREITFRVGTTENAVLRNYPLELSFDYTDAADNDNQDTEYVEFRPQSQPHFSVESVESTVPIAGTGFVEITLRNDGPMNATEATLSISSAVDAVFFGSGSTSEPIEARGFVIEQPRTGTPNSETYIGDWPVGETRTVYFRAGFDENAITRDYPAELTVNYDNPAGNDMPAQSRSIGVRPLPNQTFEFELVETDLYVGEEGDLVGRITNVGNRTAEGLVVTAENQRQNINFYTNRYAIGTLEPGESSTFRYRVGVTEETEHGPRLFEVSARYRDPQGNVRHTDTQDLAVGISPDRDTFAVDTDDVAFSPGESGELEVTVTNRRNETLSNIQAKLFTDDPLDSNDDSAFIQELGPGESTTITLDVSVGASAMEKTYSASMDFRFDDARGDSELSDTYRVPVTVEQEEGGPTIPVLLGVFVTFAGATAVGWRFDALQRCRERCRGLFGN